MPLFPFLILLLPSLALSAPFKVLQEDCSEIDLRERFGPNRDQGSSEFCFAFVAADLIGEAIRLPPSQKISALGVAVSYMSMDREDFRQSQRRVNFENAAPMFSRKFSLPGQNLAVRMEKGGNVEIAIARMMQEGSACLESKLPSDASQFGQRELKFLERRLLEMEKEASRIPLGLPEECAFHELGTGDLRTASDQLLALVNSIQDILLLQMKNGAYASCGATVPLPNIPIHSVLYESPGKEKDASRKITDLIHRRIPLGVQFDSCLVFGGCAEKREIDHTMIIVGRRWNPAAQSCELLLRNSYGNRCPEPLPDATRCEAGNWWIAQEKLSESPLEFIFVDR